MFAHAGSPALADYCDEDPQSIGSDRDYASGKLAIERKDWKHAVQHFERAARQYPDSADIQTYLGYAYRRSGKVAVAFVHYKQALKLDPRHRGAHEYIGEAYLTVGDLVEAQKYLDALRQICLLSCDALGNLEREIQEYRVKSTATRLY